MDKTSDLLVGHTSITLYSTQRKVKHARNLKWGNISNIGLSTYQKMNMTIFHASKQSTYTTFIKSNQITYFRHERPGTPVVKKIMN